MDVVGVPLLSPPLTETGLQLLGAGVLGVMPGLHPDTRHSLLPPESGAGEGELCPEDSGQVKPQSSNLITDLALISYSQVVPSSWDSW